MSSMTRGPLSAGVYWRRRLAVLSVAVLLVVGIARILGGGSDGSSDDDGRASLADAPVSSGTPSATPSAGPTAPATSTGKPGKKGKPGEVTSSPVAPTSTAPVLAVPDGPCVDSDVAVTPEVTEAIGGPDHGVVISLEVRSVTDEACTWKVSASSLAVKITSGNDDIWSSRECPRAIAAQQLTVRRAVSATVTLTWNARRSDEDCSRLTEWALPGWYHVSAAAIGGEPSEVQFELLAPQPGVVTETVDPQQGKGGKGGKNGAGGTNGTTTPSQTPSGAVEPDATSQDG